MREDASDIGSIAFGHRLIDFTQHDDRVELRFETPLGPRSFEAGHVLACDGGRSTVRDKLGVKVQGQSFPERYCLVDLKVDLDVREPARFPLPRLFQRRQGWMILIRHPAMLAFPVSAGAGPEGTFHRGFARQGAALHRSGIECRSAGQQHLQHPPSRRRQMAKRPGPAARRMRPTSSLRCGRWDSTPASSMRTALPGAWHGTARLGDDSLLGSYESEQKPVAEQGSGEMAEAARKYMASLATQVKAMTEHDWGKPIRARCWASGWNCRIERLSMVKSLFRTSIGGVGGPGPDGLLQDAEGREIRLHDLFGPSFVALYFTDTRRRPAIPLNDTPWLSTMRFRGWDAPLDSDIRTRSLLDPGGRIARRYGLQPRYKVSGPADDYIAAIEPMSRTGTGTERAYRSAIGALKLERRRHDDFGYLSIRRCGHPDYGCRKRHRRGLGTALRAAGRDRHPVDLPPRRSPVQDRAWLSRPHRNIRELDVSKNQKSRRLLDDVKRRYSRLDAAVLGAAIQVRTDIDKMSVAHGARFSMSISWRFLLPEASFRSSRHSGTARLSRFTSGLALTGCPATQGLCGQQGRMIGMIKSTAHELKISTFAPTCCRPGCAPHRSPRCEHAEGAILPGKTIGVGDADGVVPTLLYSHIGSVSEN